MYRALIVCNSRFQDAALAELHSPKTDGILLKDALINRETGMFDENDVQLLNEEGLSEVIEAINRFFGVAEPDETLLFYYSGHALIRTRSYSSASETRS